MSKKKLDFSEIDWENTAFGIKSKSFTQTGKKVRLLELSKGLEHPNWCEVGHIGYVIEGELEIDFNGEIVCYLEGDVILISSGEKEKHIPIPISDKVVLLLFEDD